MKRALKISLYTLIALSVVWIGLTLWVQRPGAAMRYQLNETRQRQVWIIYDPDPIYDLDRQLAEACAKAWAQYPWRVTVATVAALPDHTEEAEVFVFLANTYNWRPDWAVTDAIDRCALTGKKCFALALGAGSTEEAEEHLIKKLTASGAEVLGAKSFWVLRPNDEQRLEEDNTRVACEVAHRWMDKHIQTHHLTDSSRLPTPR